MAINLKDELFKIVTALGEAGLEYALCGGMAVVIHGYPRLTRDIDLLIVEKDLGRVRKVLGRLGYTLSAGIIPFDIGKPHERRIFRITKVEGEDFLALDLVLANPTLIDVFQERMEYELDDTKVCVVSKSGLLKMKRLAGRPQDLNDISELGPDTNEQ
jgi:hypothetical protein